RRPAVPRLVRNSARVAAVAGKAAGNDHRAGLLGARSMAGAAPGAAAAEGAGPGEDERAHARCRARRALPAGGRRGRGGVVRAARGRTGRDLVRAAQRSADDSLPALELERFGVRGSWFAFGSTFRVPGFLVR